MREKNEIFKIYDTGTTQVYIGLPDSCNIPMQKDVYTVGIYTEREDGYRRWEISLFEANAFNGIPGQCPTVFPTPYVENDIGKIYENAPRGIMLTRYIITSRPEGKAAITVRQNQKNSYFEKRYVLDRDEYLELEKDKITIPGRTILEINHDFS